MLVVQQHDGSFKVQLKDGSLTGDGFTGETEPEAAEAELPATEPPRDSDGGVCAGRTGDRFPGAGSAGAGQTGAGSAGAGIPGAFITTEQPLQRSSPLPPPSRLLWPAATRAQREGEEGKEQDLASGLDAVDALVAEIRAIRPEWSSQSIRRALAHPDVTERGWDRARPAMLAVAADPQSLQPGRLAHGGPWWNQPRAPVRSHCKPPWCGECSDERTRQVSLPGGKITRCPGCHPLSKQAS